MMNAFDIRMIGFKLNVCEWWCVGVGERAKEKKESEKQLNLGCEIEFANIDIN